MNRTAIIARHTAEAVYVARIVGKATAWSAGTILDLFRITFAPYKVSLQSYGDNSVTVFIDSAGGRNARANFLFASDSEHGTNLYVGTTKVPLNEHERLGVERIVAAWS